MVYVRAQVGPPNVGDSAELFTVQYLDEDGNMIIRSGGSRAWRCNNPGNLKASTYSTGRNRRSIGTAGRGENVYAVYPDYKTGHEALLVMMRGSVYSPLTLREAMHRYDSNNPLYIDEIVKITKFDPERTIKSLNDKDFEKFWKAIEKIEEWRPGEEEFFEKWIISGVHKTRGVISEYRINKSEGNEWFSKENALKLAGEHRLHAVIVHLKNGTKYLQPEYKASPFRRLVEGA